MIKLKKYMMIMMLAVCTPLLAGEGGGDHAP